MDKERKYIAKRSDVLRKLNAESLQIIERGLLGDIPDKLRPQPQVPPRGHSTELVVARPSGLLSSCLPVPDSPKPEIQSTEDDVSPLKKTFSFRDKFSRMYLFSKDKEKTKHKSVEDEPPKEDSLKVKEHEYKSRKRFWFFRNKELMEKKSNQHRPVYKRSKSFEFLPRAIEEEPECNVKNQLTKNQSYSFGSSDTLADPWSSNESLERISDVYYDDDNTVFLKSIKEFPSESSNNNSSMSNATSASSGLVLNIMKGKSMQELLDEFEKTVDMFGENYSSDCEPYTKTNRELSMKEKRMSSSWSNLPSPKVMQVNKVDKISEGFKVELSRLLEMKRDSCARSVRRGSVTDWFVLEDKSSASEQNKYRRAQKKPTQRVRRISSTKYVSSLCTY